MLRFKEFHGNYNLSYIAWGNATLYTGNVCWTWTVYGAVLFGGCAQCDCSEQALGCLPLILHFINDRYYLPNIILVFFQEILHSLALERPLKDISFFKTGDTWQRRVLIKSCENPCKKFCGRCQVPCDFVFNPLEMTEVAIWPWFSCCWCVFSVCAVPALVLLHFGIEFLCSFLLECFHVQGAIW